MTINNLKIDREQINPTELSGKSAHLLIDFFHTVSLIYAPTTRKHTPEFVLYKTKEFLQNAIPWLNALFDVNDEFEANLLEYINTNIKNFNQNENDVNAIVEFVTVNLMYNDSKARLDILDYVVCLISLVMFKYNYTLEQIFEF